MKRSTLRGLRLAGLAAVAALFVLPLGSVRPEGVLALARTARADAPATPALTLAPEAPSRVDAFGFPERAYRTAHAEATTGSLEAFFVAEGVSLDAALRLAGAARTALGADGFAEGRPLHLYRAGDRLSHVVYEPDDRSYVVLRPGLLPVVLHHERPVEVLDRVAEVEIAGSVGASLERGGADPALADSVAAIFAERFGLGIVRRGDALAVSYTERHVGDSIVEMGDVQAVRLQRGRQTHVAIRFTLEDGTVAYFDEQGRSLRDLFLDAPLEHGVMTSAYSLARFHPVLQYTRPHLGTDFAAPTGTPILAIGDGVVTDAAYGGGNGNFVRIRHDATYTTGYLHMVRHAEGVRAGASVKRGQVIGYVGQTGLATGPHVCFRFWKRGVQVDFLREPIPPAAPVPAAERARFFALRDALLEKMEGVSLRDRIEIEPALDLSLVLGTDPLGLGAPAVPAALTPPTFPVDLAISAPLAVPVVS